MDRSKMSHKSKKIGKGRKSDSFFSDLQNKCSFQVRKYLDAANVVLSIVDKSGNIKFINKKGLAFYGHEAADVIGRNLFDFLLPKSYREEVRTAFYEVVSGEVEATGYYENIVVNGSGEERLFAWHYDFLKNEQNEIVEVVSSGIDITEQRSMEKSLAETKNQYVTLIENIPGVVYQCALDEKWSMEFISEEVEKLLGYPASDFTSKKRFFLDSIL